LMAALLLLRKRAAKYTAIAPRVRHGTELNPRGAARMYLYLTSQIQTSIRCVAR
jgi:hypothetical protein